MKRILFASLIAGVLCAGEWPAWRGPSADGVSTEKNLPVKWDLAKDTVWKLAVPGNGHSTPIVCRDRIFLTTAVEKERQLMCLDRSSGKILWTRAFLVADLEKKHKENSYASSSPTTDGETVFVTTMENGSNVVMAAYDFGGNQKWLNRTIGYFYSQWGFTHNPVLWKDRVFIVCAGSTGAFAAALRKSDGNLIWKTVFPTEEKYRHAFSPAFVRKIGDRELVIAEGASYIHALDPENGKIVWKSPGPSLEYLVSPVYSEKHNLLVSCSSWSARTLVALDPNGRMVWETKENAPHVPSLLTEGDFLYTLAAIPKAATCLDVRTGKEIWRSESLGIHHASPVLADGKLYFVNDDGIVNVFRAGGTLEPLARNEMNEPVYASPVPDKGQWLIRTFSNLYCIGIADIAAKTNR